MASKAKLSAQEELLELLSSENDLVKKSTELLYDQLDSQKNISAAQKNQVKTLNTIVSTEKSSIDINDKLIILKNRAKEVNDKTLDSEIKRLKVQKAGTTAVQAQSEALLSGLNKSLDMFKKIPGGGMALEAMGLGSKNMGKLQKNMSQVVTGGMKFKNVTKGLPKGFGKTAMKAGAIGIALGAAYKLLSFISGIVDKLGSSFGVIGGQTSKFQNDMLDASVNVISLGKSTEDVVTVVSTLSSEFGIGLETAVGITEQILDTAVATGMATGEATKLFGTLITIGNLTADQAENLTESTYQLAAQNKVNPSVVMQDIAQSSETIAKFGARNLKSISKAAIQARQLGLNLSDVASISDGMLDFQSSLTAEFEAEVLLGRDLELSKARMLALDGDLNGVMKEIVKNVGSEAEFNKLNVIERKSLAKALGMNITQLNKIVSLQDKSVVQQKNFADIAGKDGMSALTNIKNTFKELGAVVMKELGKPLNDALVNIRDNFFTEENIQKIKTGLKNVVGIIKSVATVVMNLLEGIYNIVDVLSFGSLTDFDELFPKQESVMDFNSSGGSHLILTPKGKMLKTNPRDTVRGSTQVNDFSSGPAGSMPLGSPTSDGLLAKIVEQNEVLIRAIERSPGKMAEQIERFR